MTERILYNLKVKVNVNQMIRNNVLINIKKKNDDDDEEKGSDLGGSCTGNVGSGGGNLTGPVNFRSFLFIVLDIISSVIEHLNNFFM
jgi:hypothetical protein